MPRPIGSKVRQNIIDILYFLKKGYGYDIHRIYLDLFPKVTQRLIYYHLKKGESTGEIKISEIKDEKGKYSWGETAQKVYYSLGKSANPRPSKELKDYFDKRKKTKNGIKEHISK